LIAGWRIVEARHDTDYRQKIQPQTQPIMARMAQPQFSWLDRLIIEADTALRVVAAPARSAAPSPQPLAPETLTAEQRREAGALMRVNHAGEIAAQALYRGQASVCRSDELRNALLDAADEEHAHLAWCEDRVRELGQHTSRLAPLWYTGAFAIGALAGLAGDRISLGFLAETERQVARHLDGHLERLPVGDQRSRAIIERMKAEEVAHGQAAIDRGGANLPSPLPRFMALTARIMTTLAHRL
jgi:ubiquinone biosynthesis monooxygenase Coq7